MSTPTGDVPREYDERYFDVGNVLNAVAAAVAHHHATGHDMSGSGNDAYCDGCAFHIEDGLVKVGGIGRFKR